MYKVTNSTPSFDVERYMVKIVLNQRFQNIWNLVNRLLKV